MERIREATRPVAPVRGLVVDLARSRGSLIAENLLLRQQLLVLKRQTRRPRFNQIDRVVLLGASAMTGAWRDAILLVKPDTILRWHRRAFQIFWRWRSRPTRSSPRISRETIELIRRMAAENRLWGTERIRGELLKLGIRVAKRTIQRYLDCAKGPRSNGQRWSTFLENHGKEVWACDFLQTHDIWFRPIFAFFLINVGTREVVHTAVTRTPTQVWTAQQVRNATPFGVGPRFIIRDHDNKFGADFDRAAEAVGARVIKTAVRAPDMNATCERFLRSVRHECLDHVIVLGERHLTRVLSEYVGYFNRARPHQGLGQNTPITDSQKRAEGKIISLPVLGGLHHDYRRAA
jgi:transposase InsO family protein